MPYLIQIQYLGTQIKIFQKPQVLAAPSKTGILQLLVFLASGKTGECLKMLLAFQYYRVCRTQDQDKLPSVLELS